MAGWQVGSTGTNLGSMNPRMLLQLLQMRQQQAQGMQMARARQSQAALAAQAMQQRLSQLSPEDQRDAQIYGLDYVKQKKLRQQSWDHEDAVRNAATEARAQAGQEQAQGVASDIAAGRAAPRVASLEGNRVLTPEEMTAQAAAPGLQATAPYNPMAGGIESMMQQQGMVAAQAPVQHYRIIEPAEEAILRHAKAQLPPGTISRKDYEDARAQQNLKATQDRADAAKKAVAEKKAADEVKKEAHMQSAVESLANYYEGAYDEEIKLAYSEGKKPSAIYDQIRKKIEKEADGQKKLAQYDKAQADKEAARQDKAHQADLRDYHGQHSELVKRYADEELLPLLDQWEKDHPDKNMSSVTRAKLNIQARQAARDRVDQELGAPPKRSAAAPIHPDAARAIDDLETQYKAALAAGDKTAARAIWEKGQELRKQGKEAPVAAQSMRREMIKPPAPNQPSGPTTLEDNLRYRRQLYAAIEAANAAGEEVPKDVLDEANRIDGIVKARGGEQYYAPATEMPGARSGVFDRIP